MRGRTITNLGQLRVALAGLEEENDALPVVVNAGACTLHELLVTYHTFASLGVGAECVEVLTSPTCPIPRSAAQVIADLLPSMQQKCEGDAVAAHFFGAVSSLLAWVRTQEPAPKEEW
jgi:hypothetical protein